MSTKFCIIHEEWVANEVVNFSNDISERNLAETALREIVKIRKHCTDVVCLEHGDPASIADHYKAGDIVVLC